MLTCVHSSTYYFSWVDLFSLLEPHQCIYEVFLLVWIWWNVHPTDRLFFRTNYPIALTFFSRRRTVVFGTAENDTIFLQKCCHCRLIIMPRGCANSALICKMQIKKFICPNITVIKGTCSKKFWNFVSRSKYCTVPCTHVLS